MNQNFSREELKETYLQSRYGNYGFNEKELLANKIFQGLAVEAHKQISDEYHFDAIKFTKEVQATRLYNAIQKMPKGSHHHCHLDSHPNAEWYVKKTYDPTFYMQPSTKTIKIFHNNKNIPEDFECINEARKKAGNVAEFDENLKVYFTLLHHEDRAWPTFENKISNRGEISRFAKYWEDLVLTSFTDCINDGIQNFQARFFIGFIHDDNERFLTIDEEMQIYERCIKAAQKIDPAFTFHLIIQGLRFWDNAKIKEYLDQAYEAKKKYKDLIIGFDLVAEETLRDANDFAHIFDEHNKIQEKEGVKFPYIFHAGESIKLNNNNLIEVISLGSPRVGHGLNLIKHAYLMDTMKKKDICVEACPLSNHILGYINDLRLHPLTSYVNYGLRVSISSDDDGVFNTNIASLDFFTCAFSMEFGLREFKKLCIDSIECSCIEDEEIKKNLKSTWEKRWEQYIEKLIELA